MSEENSVFVREKKFNGTATLEIEAKNKRLAKQGARRFWKEQYDTRPSKIVAEKDNSWENCYTVMVADHSSGSLKGNRTYEI